jgi:hypothetical protein
MARVDGSAFGHFAPEQATKHNSEIKRPSTPKRGMGHFGRKTKKTPQRSARMTSAKSAENTKAALTRRLLSSRTTANQRE